MPQQALTDTAITKCSKLVPAPVGFKPPSIKPTIAPKVQPKVASTAIWRADRAMHLRPENLS